jgi:hypothetical protein
MIDNGIKPCYVFDGKPPTMKSEEVHYSIGTLTFHSWPNAELNELRQQRQWRLLSRMEIKKISTNLVEELSRLPKRFFIDGI